MSKMNEFNKLTFWNVKSHHFIIYFITEMHLKSVPVYQHMQLTPSSYIRESTVAIIG